MSFDAGFSRRSAARAGEQNSTLFLGKELKAKGQNFHGVLAAVEELKGSELRRKVLHELSGEVGDALRFGNLLAHCWYPVSWYGQLLGAVAKQAPFEAQLIREVGRVSAARDIRGVYRLVFRMLSIETVIKQAPRLFRLFYDGGDVSIVELGEGSGKVQYKGCFGFDRVVWLDLIGGSEAIFSATGAANIRTRIEQGGGDGDSNLLVSVTWA